MNNVVVRSISGVVFILAMLACLMFNKFLFAGLIIFIMSVMLLEFYHITMGNSYTFSKVLAIHGFLSYSDKIRGLRDGSDLHRDDQLTVRQGQG